MTLWARHLGFLNAKIDGSDKTRLEMNPGQPLPPLPDVTGHMVAAFEAMGRAFQTGMGRVPLPFAEIAAAAPWADEGERHLLRDMSREYLIGMAIGTDGLGKAPWEG